MNKYKRGDKFVFEVVNVIERGSGEVIYLCNNTMGRCTEKMLDNFKRFNPEEKADWWSDGYNSGLIDAWEAARKIDIDRQLEDACVPTETGESPFEIYTASEAISKIQDYEKKAESEIKVGDEIIFIKKKLIVTHTANMYVMGLDNTGSMYCAPRDNAEKTGRHFPEIENVLKAMKTDDADTV